MDQQITVQSPPDLQLVLYRLDQQDKVLAEIAAHVKKTNGRVTALELAQAKEEGAKDAREKAEKVKQFALNLLIAFIVCAVTCGMFVTGIIAL